MQQLNFLGKFKKAFSTFLGFFGGKELKIKALFSKRHFHIWVLIAVVLIGSWLRLYHYSDWIHYEADEARDNILVGEAIKNGPASLPLLGPKASSTQLRLGPAYYYLEYLSALVFGDTPQGHTLFVPLLSISSILFFYLLLRRFFNTPISLALSYLYSISFYLILHSRWGWNPNILPFFAIAGSYCLLRATEKKSSRPGRWLVVSVFLFGIATQAHFIAFFILPALGFSYLIYRRASFSLKAWCASILVIFALYVPVIISDIALGGYNSKEFIRAFSVKVDKDDPLVEEVIDVVRSGSEYYVTILSGNDRIWTPKIKFENGWINVSCKNSCKKTSLWMSYLAISFFLFGALLVFWRSIKRKNSRVFIGLFFALSFFVFIWISSDIESHFYLLIAPLPFFFLGNMLELVWKKNALVAKITLILVVVFFSYTNITRIFQRFSELANADKKPVSIKSDRIIVEPERISLKQFQAMAEYMAGKYQENGHPVLLWAEGIYFRSFMYLVEKNGTPVGPMQKGQVFAGTNNFVIFRTRKQGGLKSYAQDYEVLSKKEFGTLTLFELTPRVDRIAATDPPHLPSSFDYIAVPFQITWGDALSKIRAGNLGL